MSKPGEIITFQIGNYANFVGAHFFNLQDPVLHPEYESIFNYHALWREGRNAQRGRIVTPRVLMFDVKDNWSNKFVRKSGGTAEQKNRRVVRAAGGESGNLLLENLEKGIAWDGNVQKVVLEEGSSESEEESGSSRKRNQKVKVGQYDESNNWGDYVKWRLHSTDKFAFRIPNFMYNAESGELASYGQGLDVYRRLEESVAEGIRSYAEDCDYLEGFQILVDEYDGYTGIAGGILEHLGDEYDKKACLGLGLNRPLPEQADKSLSTVMKGHKIRISNTVQLWTAFNRHARVFSSLGVCEDVFSRSPVARKFPGIVKDCNLPSISSAVLAATLDSLTAPYRMHKPSFPLHEMTSLLNAFGHKMALIGSSVPFPMNQRTLFKALNEDGFSSLTSMTPNVELDLDVSIGNVFVMRGFNPDHVMSPLESREFKHANINTVTACSELYCQESYPRSVHVIKDIPTPFKLAHPYPNLHEPTYLNLHSRERRHHVSQGDSWLLPAMASAHNTPSIGKLLEKLISITGGGTGGSAMKMKSFYEPSSETCNSTTIDFEDYAECLNDLDNLKDTYSKE